MSSIKLVFDEAIDDGALAYTLIPNEHDFKFDGMFFVSRVTQFLVYSHAHFV